MRRALFRLALLAYPRAFRKRFGAEMWTDFERTVGTTSTFGTFGTYMSDSLTITDNRTGKQYEVPIQDGTIRATDLRQIKVTPDEFAAAEGEPD